MNTSDNIGSKSIHSNQLIGRGILLLYKIFIKPKSTDEDIRRHEFILNTILSSLVCITLILNGSLIYNSIIRGDDYDGFSITIFSLICITFIGLLGLSRRGWLKTSSYILLILCFVCTTYTEYHWGMSSPAGLLGYALIITMSSILISSRFGIFTSLIISFILTSFAYIESQSNVIAAWKKEVTMFTNGIQYSFILLSITTLSWLYAKEIEKSLKRARKSEQALREKNESLEEIVEERTRALKQSQIEKMSQMYRFVEFGKLSSGIFHDLLNPLSVVSLNVQGLQSSLHSDLPEVKENIERAVIASRRMEQFIKSVTKQVQTQHASIEFSVNKEIEESLLLFDYKARKGNVYIIFNATEEIPLYGNPLKLQQILSNLISNAIDAFIHSSQKFKERNITITIKKLEYSVQLSVSDTGSGIQQEHLLTIFDPFFSTKEDHTGFGMGLYTTKTLIEKDFKGTIEVKSTLGLGTTFTITIPTQLHEQSQTNYT